MTKSSTYSQRAKPLSRRAGPLSRVGAAIAVCALVGAVGCDDKKPMRVSHDVDFDLAKAKPKPQKKDDIATHLMLAYMKDPEGHFLLHMEGFKYHHHQCTEHGSDFVCTACYTHPKNYLGAIYLKCPETCIEDSCYRICKLIFGEDELKENGIDISYCERSFQTG